MGELLGQQNDLVCAVRGLEQLDGVEELEKLDGVDVEELEKLDGVELEELGGVWELEQLYVP